MARLSLWRSMAALALSAVVVRAQNPAQTWSAGQATCSNGLANPAAQPPGGTFIDQFGANYSVECAQDSTGFVYDANQGTNGQGVYACFQGCDKRPGCVGFYYQGSVSSNAPSA